jgi:hypothetical protein
MRLVANFIAPTFAYQSRRAGGRITVFTYFMSTDIHLFIATRTHKLAASEKIKYLVMRFISIIVDVDSIAAQCILLGVRGVGKSAELMKTNS